MMKPFKITGVFAVMAMAAAALLLFTGCEKESENAVSNQPVTA